MEPPVPPLAQWQQEFVDQFLAQKNSRSLLVAAPGTGKSSTALVAATQMLRRGAADSLLVISSFRALRDQWRDLARRYGVELNTVLDHREVKLGISITVQALKVHEAERWIEEVARTRRWFIVADEPHHDGNSFAVVVDRMLELNPDSRALFISHTVPNGISYEAEFRFGSELALYQSLADVPATELRIARLRAEFSAAKKASGKCYCAGRLIVEGIRKSSGSTAGA